MPPPIQIHVGPNRQVIEYARIYDQSKGMLLPWKDFPSIRQRAFDEVYTILHPTNGISPRLFSPQLHFEELGRVGRLLAKMTSNYSNIPQSKILSQTSSLPWLPISSIASIARIGLLGRAWSLKTVATPSVTWRRTSKLDCAYPVPQAILAAFTNPSMPTRSAYKRTRTIK